MGGVGVNGVVIGEWGLMVWSWGEWGLIVGGVRHNSAAKSGG